MMVLEWFLQDHVTLRTGQTAAEKSALHHSYILFIKIQIYLNRNYYFICIDISQYYCFTIF